MTWESLLGVAGIVVTIVTAKGPSIMRWFRARIRLRGREPYRLGDMLPGLRQSNRRRHAQPQPRAHKVQPSPFTSPAMGPRVPAQLRSALEHAREAMNDPAVRRARDAMREPTVARAFQALRDFRL